LLADYERGLETFSKILNDLNDWNELLVQAVQVVQNVQPPPVSSPATRGRAKQGA